MWKERFVGLLWWIDGLRGGGFFFGEIGSCGVVCCVVEGNRGERERKKGRERSDQIT